MARNRAVECLQLEGQLFTGQLILKRGIVAAGFSHHSAEHPQEKTKFHAHSLNGYAAQVKSGQRRSVAVCRPGNSSEMLLDRRGSLQKSDCSTITGPRTTHSSTQKNGQPT
jgi:hypothetical protein